MGDRGRGRGPRPEFGSRPLGRMPEFGGRSLGRGPGPGNRPLGNAPVRSSSGGLTPLGAAGLGAAIGGAAAAAAAGGSSSAAAGGRGAGPDHREVRYADGVLAMINVLRMLTLGGPRTWDSNMYKQVGMQIAHRPSTGAAGREVNIMVNHFALNLRPGNSMAVYDLAVTRQQQQQQQGSGSSEAAAASSSSSKALPRGLAQRVVSQLAAGGGWPSDWLLVGSSKLAAGSSTSSFLSTNSVTEATVTLPQHQQTGEAGSAAAAAAAADGVAGSSSSSSSGGGTFKVSLSYLGTQQVNDLRAAAAADAAGGMGPLLDGIHLLEALLLAAALQQPAAGKAAAAAAATAPLPVPPAPGAAAAAASGMLGLAGGLAGPAAPQLLLGSSGAAAAAAVGSPAAAAPGLLAGSLSPAATPPPPPAAAGGGSSSSLASGGGTGSGLLTAVGLTSAPRVRIGDTVYFHAPGNPDLHAPLGLGAEAWLGFKQCVKNTQLGPAFVVDLTAAPFFEPGPLLAALPGLLGRPAALLPAEQQEAAAGGGDAAAAAAAGGGGGQGSLAALSAGEQMRLEGMLKGVKVEVSLPGKPPKLFTITGLSASSAAATTLTLSSSNAAGEAGSVVTVADYFKAVYNVELTAPQLPCVDVSHQPGSSIWYPLELCSLPPGQRYHTPLEASQLACLARLGCKKSSDRKTWLEALVAPLAAAAPPVATPGVLPLPAGDAAAAAAAAAGGGGGGGVGGGTHLAGAGVDVSGLLGVVRGRVLPAPHLAYATPECCYPGSQGQWNVKSCRLPGCSRIGSWALVVLLPQSQVDVEGPSGVLPFMQDLTASLNSVGLDCSMPPIVYEQPGMSVLHHMRAGCEAAQKHFNASAELLLVMLPSRSASLYQEVKMASDAALGLPSQVLVAPVAGVGRGASPRGRLQYCANLGLKINAKMGGVNMRLAGNPDQVIPVVGGRPFILFGVALAPPPLSAPAGTPAAAAVVASRDRSLGRYSSRVLLQPWAAAAAAAEAGEQQQQSQYIVQGLRGAAKALLIDFYRQNGGRKPEALICYRSTSAEGQGQAVVTAEYEALRAACFELEESYCPPITFVSVNRSHNTRLFPADRDNQDKAGNCLPGTVVDTGICHPTQFDFFLNSHAGLQGHNKPAHYHVLVDENGFSADGLQVLTYWLCYLYCRCTRSVSVVPPAYYAQLAAGRGRLIATGRDAIAADTADDSSPVDFDVRVNAKLGGSMYYV